MNVQVTPERVVVEAVEHFDVLVVGAAPPGARSFSLITFLAEKLLGHLTVPLVVVPGNLTDEQISNMT